MRISMENFVAVCQNLSGNPLITEENVMEQLKKLGYRENRDGCSPCRGCKDCA